MQNTEQEDTLFSTSKRELVAIWDEIQRVQTDFCFAQEISAYYMSDYWINDVRTVLDIGTGNGYYLSRLQRLFPDKQYAGIDKASEFIDIARAASYAEGIHFGTQDFFNAEGSYDCVITRLLWQHLPESEVPRALGKLERLIKPGGRVMIIDAMDEVRRFVPKLSEFQKVIDEYKQQQTRLGRNRDVVDVLVELVKEQGDGAWTLAREIPIILPSTIPGYLDLYHRIYALWIELFEAAGELDMDFTAAKRELAEWSRDMHGYTQAGIRILQLNHNN